MATANEYEVPARDSKGSPLTSIDKMVLLTTTADALLSAVKEVDPLYDPSQAAPEQDPGDGLPSWSELDSTCLAAAAYDHTDQVMVLDFQNGYRYAYYNVPAYIYKALVLAGSNGRYFNRRIRPTFGYQRLA